MDAAGNTRATYFDTADSKLTVGDDAAARTDDLSSHIHRQVIGAC